MSGFDAAKEILLRLPLAKVCSQPEGDWSGEFPLPAGIAEYYRELGPMDVIIESWGNPYSLPRLANLWSHQTGYRTHGFSGERLTDWMDDWLVVADQGGDPFIFSRHSGTILHAFHGEGTWAPVEVFGNLPELVASVAILGELSHEAGRDLADENSILRSRYVQIAHERLSHFVGSRTKANLILSRLGWEAK